MSTKTVNLLAAGLLASLSAAAGIATAAVEIAAVATPPTPCHAASPATRDRHLLIVSGLGGETYYRTLFARWAMDFARLAGTNLRIPRECIVYLAALSELTANAPSAARTGDATRADVSAGTAALGENLAATADGPASKARLLAEIARLGEESQPDDIILLFLIGHGTARGEDARFNLPGPDLTPDELDQALTALAGRHTVVVLATSASGAFLTTLSAPGRVIVTATASGQENRHARFGGAFVEAYSSPEADTDKNGRTSIAEAYEYARHRVAGIYTGERRLQTEHAMLDDRDEGRAAAALHLAIPRSVSEGLHRPPAVLALERNARRLVERIDALKRDRRGLSAEEFDTDLEAILVELAVNQRKLRSHLGAPSPTSNVRDDASREAAGGERVGRHWSPTADEPRREPEK